MSRSESDHSIRNEPHITNQFEADPSEYKASERLNREKAKETQHDQIDHAVWNEPTLSGHLIEEGIPEDALTYEKWLKNQIKNTSFLKSWGAVFLIALAAGPFSIIGTFLQGRNTAFAVILICLVGPITEEMMKIALPLWVVEKRPYLFRSATQIAICVFVSGLVFAAIENVLYLHVYFPDPPREMVIWRWTVCVALHAGCALISGLGLIRIWSNTMTNFTPPQLNLGPGFIFLAILTHGSYNLFALIFSFLE